MAETVLPEFASMDAKELLSHSKALAPMLVQLTLCESLEVREANALLLGRILGELQTRAGVN